MKKTALTFGLFSLLMVATSFTTIETINVSNKVSAVDPPGGGGGSGMTGGGRKVDGIKKESTDNSAQSGFANINQSVGANKKID